MKHKSLIFFSLVLSAILFNTNKSKAEIKGKHGGDSSIYAGFKPHTSLFYSLDFGTCDIQTSSALNNWLLNNSYGKNNGYSFSNGASLIKFEGKWMTEANEQFQSLGNNAQIQFQNVSIGAGYKIIPSNICSLYGILTIGLSTLNISPTQTIINEYSRYNQPPGSYLSQNLLLLDPHLMLYRNITNNLSKHPDFLSKIGVGIVAGYNITMVPGSWLYGYSGSRPFYAVHVDGIPHLNSDGIYFLGKIGWNFGKQ